MIAVITAVLAVAAVVVPNGAAASTRTVPDGSPRSEGRALHGTPTQVIDAQKNPDAAGAALDAGCADLKKCDWQTTNVTTGYGPRSVLGDVLYNCSTDDDDLVETQVGVSDERSETTSLSEEVSVKLQGGLIGLATASVEFKAFSKQAETFSTKVTTGNAVPVKAGWKGFTTTQLMSGQVTGDTYITAGIDKLIEVKGIMLTFPGFEDPDDTSPQIIENGNRLPMTSDDISSRCNAVNAAPSSGLGGAKPKPHGRRKTVTGRFKLTLCRPGAGCAARTVSGPPPPDIGPSTVTLTARGRTYATGTDAGGDIRLTLHRSLDMHLCNLTLRTAPSRSRDGSYVRLAYRRVVVVPITIP
jgi:hypothetical protein